MEQGNNNEGFLSLSKKIQMGVELYEDEKTGFELWKSDLKSFLSEDFQKEWHSTDKSEFKNAARKLDIWQASSVFTYMFRGTWGDEFSDKRTEALNCLKEAKSSSHIIDKRIESIINNVIDAANTSTDYY